MNKKRKKIRYIFWIFLFSIMVVLRYLYAKAVFPLTTDSPVYLWYAKDILNGNWFISTFRENWDYRITYTLFSSPIALLTIFVKDIVSAGRLFCFMCGLFSLITIGLISKEFKKYDTTAALLCALICGFNFHLIKYSSIVLRRSPYILVFLLSILFFIKLFNLKKATLKTNIIFCLTMTAGMMIRFDYIIYPVMFFIFYTIHRLYLVWQLEKSSELSGLPKKEKQVKVSLIKKQAWLFYKCFFITLVITGLFFQGFNSEVAKKNNITQKAPNYISGQFLKEASGKGLISTAVAMIKTSVNNVFRTFYHFILPEMLSPLFFIFIGIGISFKENTKSGLYPFIFAIIFYTIMAFSIHPQNRYHLRYYLHLLPLFIIMSAHGMLALLRSSNTRLIQGILIFLLLFGVANEIKITSAVLRDPDTKKIKKKFKNLGDIVKKMDKNMGNTKSSIICYDSLFAWYGNRPMRYMGKDLREKKICKESIQGLFKESSDMLILSNEYTDEKNYNQIKSVLEDETIFSKLESFEGIDFYVLDCLPNL